MLWYVFDLDETLGDFYTSYYFLCDLQTKTFFKDTNPNKSIHISPELERQLQTIYSDFVSKIASAEDSDTPLGILRPGIIDIMRAIQNQRKSGIAENVIIYSNNASLATLQFARDIIRKAIGVPDFISDCIHWYHPLREGEIQKGKPGYADKTFSVITNVIKHITNDPSIEIKPSQVVFFDDVLHVDMMLQLSDTNYLVVKPYSYRTPFKHIAQIYQDAILKSNIQDNINLYNEYKNHLKKYCGIPLNLFKSNIDNNNITFPQIQYFRSLTQNTSALSTTPPQNTEEHERILQMVMLQGEMERLRKKEQETIQLRKNIHSGGNRKHHRMYKKTRRYNRRR
jgi:hypothetical protein